MPIPFVQLTALAGNTLLIRGDQITALEEPLTPSPFAEGAHGTKIYFSIGEVVLVQQSLKQVVNLINDACMREGRMEVTSMAPQSTEGAVPQ